MKKSIELLEGGFESSSGLTPEFSKFARTFKSEFAKLLKSLGAVKVEIGRGHFYMSGFWQVENGQVYYFSLSDVRWFDGKMLVRTAKDFKDYTGGRNNFVSLDSDLEASIARFMNNYGV